MLTIENYHYSDPDESAVLDTHRFNDDDTIEIEMNIRYPVRFKVAALKKDLIENEMVYSFDNERLVTAEEFEKDPVVDDETLFHVLWQCLVAQAIGECYDNFDEETAKKVYEVMKNSEIAQLLSDICNPMRIKKLTEADLNRITCCGPFPKLK